jgi:hypothetical protein
MVLHTTWHPNRTYKQIKHTCAKDKFGFEFTVPSAPELLDMA